MLSFIFSVLSFLVPVIFMIRHDVTQRKHYSLLEFVSVYPVFVVIYIIARIWIAFDYYFVMFFAEMIGSLTDHTQSVKFASQMMIFLIDIFFWSLFSKNTTMNLRLYRAAIILFSEAILLTLIEMIIPFLAEGLVSIILG